MNLNRERDLRKVNFHKIDDRKKEFQRKGYFHKWVTYSSEEGSEEYALIESLDGTMIETFPTNIVFELRNNITYVYDVNCKYDELEEKTGIIIDCVSRIEGYINKDSREYYDCKTDHRKRRVVYSINQLKIQKQKIDELLNKYDI